MRIAVLIVGCLLSGGVLVWFGCYVALACRLFGLVALAHSFDCLLRFGLIDCIRWF